MTQFYHGSPFPNGRAYLAGAQDNGTVLGRDGFGINGWVSVQGGDGGYSAINPTNTNEIYVTFQNGAIRKSIDGGATFNDAVSGITDLAANDSSNFRAFGDFFLFISPLLMDSNDPQRLWSGGRRLWRTDNGAASWSAASAPLLSGGKASSMAVADGNSDLVLAGSDTGHIYRSDSATSAADGASWSSSGPEVDSCHR